MLFETYYLTKNAVEPGMCLLQVALLGLKPGSNDSFSCVDMAIWRDFAVGVWKRRFMVETL